MFSTLSVYVDVNYMSRKDDQRDEIIKKLLQTRVFIRYEGNSVSSSVFLVLREYLLFLFIYITFVNKMRAFINVNNFFNHICKEYEHSNMLW